MTRIVARLAVIAPLLIACAPSEPAGDQDAAPAAEQDATPAAEQPAEADRITLAESAAPAAISAAATIVEFTADGTTTELRAGTNGWLCVPDDPTVPGVDPACYDGVWQELLDAYMQKTTPNITRLGISYMLQGGGSASNTDPFATEPAEGQDWILDGPHVMLIVPNPAESLQGISTDPKSGGPYVMWGGTDYAHIMLPVGK